MKFDDDLSGPSLPRLFVDRLTTGAGEVLPLDDTEAHHVRVRRLRDGDEVEIFDGKGTTWVAGLESGAGKTASVRLLRRLPQHHRESPAELTLAVALLKTDKLDWIVEKATELGVSRIRPFASRFSLARPSANRIARWRQIARAAGKQCGRSVIPIIDEPCDYLALFDGSDRLVVLFCEAPESPRLALDGRLDRVQMIVGPEGGFAPEEVAQARARAAVVAGLGPRVLRAETAAVVAVALCQHLCGDG